MENSGENIGSSAIGLLIIVGVVLLPFVIWKRPKVYFINKNSNEKDSLRVGFNFSLYFLSSICFGLILYLWGFTKWGIFFTLFTLSFAFLTFTNQLDENMFLVFGIANVILSSFIGFHGNQAKARSLLKKGYEFQNPDSESVKYAKRKWKIE